MCTGKLSRDDFEISTSKFATKNAPIQLRWLAHWKGEGKKEDFINYVGREFEFLNQEYRVSIIFPNSVFSNAPDNKIYDLTCDSIAQMVRQNTWPFDVMICDTYRYNRVGELLNDPNWGSKYLVDFLNEKWFIDAHKTGFFSTKKNTKAFQGIAPGPYIEGNSNILYLSSEVEKLLGLSVKRTDMTIDDFKMYAKAVFDYNNNHDHKITFYSFQRYTAVNLLFNQLVKSSLETDFPSSREDAINALKESYEVLAQLAPYKPLKQYIDISDNYALYNDKVLFEFYPSYVNLFWENNNPEGEKKMVPCELPSIEGKVAYSYSGQYSAVFVVPKGCKNKEGAIQFMKFLSENSTAEKWVKNTKCPTGIKNRSFYTDLGKNEYDKFFQHIKEKYEDKMDEEDLSFLLFNVNKKIDFQVEKVLNGEISYTAALESVKRQLR